MENAPTFAILSSPQKANATPALMVKLGAHRRVYVLTAVDHVMEGVWDLENGSAMKQTPALTILQHVVTPH